MQKTSKKLVSIFAAAAIMVSVMMPAGASASPWPILKTGSSGELVAALQYLLNYHGKGPVLNVDGSFGANTQKAVINFQSSKGLAKDGVVGPNTWSALTKFAQSKSSKYSNATKAIQHLLNKRFSAGIAEDGLFGDNTYKFVVALQKAYGLAQDGVVGVNTWNTLIAAPRISLNVPITGGKATPISTVGIKDSVTATRINTLHPKIRESAKSFILDVQKAGIVLRINSAYRTFEEQDALYNIGRGKQGRIVTNAKGGYSYHNYGLAIDVQEIKNGKLVSHELSDKAFWNKVVPVGKKYGFNWGGAWTSFPDKPHFEKTFGYSCSSLKAKHDEGDMWQGYVRIP